ncbi:preprotein translocase subunit SecG [Chlamydia gallinacea]|uniref:Protein-export membrane protein SecG n=1 Tax=Chlamydia gallinacea TaxID=1457153 RepID=A0ABS7ISK5_9CHLA|nr:preprotein translocase subunit SecG [Chlamydia gallinacea]AQT77447.1 preprotein translocase subunit SecG [Chlamydia gallinacea]MBX6680435.1 preprotein translocase subunit SecG [Chlamydia gallinacea]
MIGLFYTFLFVFLVLCVFLCGLILIQESKSMGLGSSFGVDSGDSMFGVSTPDILKKTTAWLALIFCCGCLFLSFATNYLGKNFHDNFSTVEETPYEGKEAPQE